MDQWLRWWQEATVGGGVTALIAALRWWLSHRRATGQPGEPNPLQRLLRWLQLAKRNEHLTAALTEVEDRMTSIKAYTNELVIDRDFYQDLSIKYMAEIRRLRAEQDASSDSETGSTATPGEKIPPPKP